MKEQTKVALNTSPELECGETLYIIETASPRALKFWRCTYKAAGGFTEDWTFFRSEAHQYVESERQSVSLPIGGQWVVTTPTLEAGAKDEKFAKATPRPWEQRGTYIIATDFDGVLVTQCCGMNHQFQLPDFEDDANASLIVAAVNSYSPEREAQLAALVDAARNLDARCEAEDGYDHGRVWSEREALLAALAPFQTETKIQGE